MLHLQTRVHLHEIVLLVLDNELHLEISKEDEKITIQTKIQLIRKKIRNKIMENNFKKFEVESLVLPVPAPTYPTALAASQADSPKRFLSSGVRWG